MVYAWFMRFQNWCTQWFMRFISGVCAVATGLHIGLNGLKNGLRSLKSGASSGLSGLSARTAPFFGAPIRLSYMPITKGF